MALSPGRGRLCIVAAALLWSLSGAFTKALTEDTGLGLNDPAVSREQVAWQIAFYRVCFAGLVLVPTLRRRDLTFRPAMLAMVACFAAMNGLFVSALTLGTAANAIWLQYTAPMWMYLASVGWLGEPADRRSSVALAVSLVGIAVIVAGGWRSGQLGIIAVALGSGLAYAGVVIFLRLLRAESPRWLTVLNHLGSALAILPILVLLSIPVPGPAQLAVLAAFGLVQMALPYWLVARGLRVVPAPEAGMLTLLEPLLNPVWAYLVAREVPSPYTVAGGVLILGALAWRYGRRGG